MHAHPISRSMARRRLLVVLGITLGLAVFEIAGSVLSGSLTLLADAGHMLSDAGGLMLALFALWFASRPSPPHRTYGYQRVEILAALVNALLLAAVMMLVVHEAVVRLRQPQMVHVAPMFVLGFLGLAGNWVGVRLLHSGAHGSLNVRGAYLEVLADMLASLGVLVAAALTWAFGWRRADPILSLGLAFFILPRIAYLLREATDVLMEAAPRDMDIDAVRQVILDQPGIVAVHDLHVWTITSGKVCLSAHVVSRDGADRDGVIVTVNRGLRARFGLEHTTLQVEGEAQAESIGQSSAEACDAGAAAPPGEPTRPAARNERRERPA